jgi:hypothetical protein
MSAWDELVIRAAKARAERNGTPVEQELDAIHAYEAKQKSPVKPLDSPSAVDSPAPVIPPPTAEAKREVPRRNNGDRKYLMDYIPPQPNGKNPLYAAVMFARELMRDGQSPDYANGWAARKYRVKRSDVAHYTGQVAGTVAGRRR